MAVHMFMSSNSSHNRQHYAIGPYIISYSNDLTGKGRSLITIGSLNKLQ